MKLVFIMLAFIIIKIPAAEAQGVRVNVNMENAAVKEVLKVIEKSSNYTFYYNDKVINTNNRVSIHARNESVSSILAKILPDCDFKIYNNKIIITEKLNGGPTESEKKISGIVKDSKGEAIIGANVMVKGTTLGTITDVDGNFSLNVPGNAVLQISYIGYITQEVSTKNKGTVNILLQEDTKTLDEVVVVGYGTMKKSDLTGSVGSVSSDKLAARGSHALKMPFKVLYQV